MKSIFLVFFVAITVFCSATEQSESSSEQNSNYLEQQLFDAVLNGNVVEVQSLIDRGVQLNPAKNPNRPMTTADYPLHHSVELQLSDRFNEDIFKLLIKNGANVETLDHEDQTPLYKAVDYGNAKAVKVLLENGANPNRYYENGRYNRSALQAAFLKNAYNEEIVELLIEHGTDVNQPDSYGYAPLHRVISEGHKKAIEMLIEKGANVNAVDETKMTPLHYIAIHDTRKSNSENWTDDDNLKFAELLINRGADVDAKARFENDDKTAFDMATSQKLKEYLQSKLT